jgi:hypothetical protein
MAVNPVSAKVADPNVQAPPPAGNNFGEEMKQASLPPTKPAAKAKAAAKAKPVPKPKPVAKPITKPKEPVLDTTYRDSFTVSPLKGEGPVAPKYEMGIKQGQRLGGIGVSPEKAPAVEVSTGFSTQLGSVSTSATYSSQWGQGTITAGNANGNVLTRAWNGVNETWDRTGGQVFKGFDLGAQAGGKADVFSGVKAKLAPKGTELTVTAAELNGKVEAGPKGALRTSFGDVKVSAGVDVKTAVGVGISAGSTTRQGAIGPVPVYAKVPTVNLTTADAKFQPKLPGAKPDFSDLRAGGKDADNELARKIQTNFSVSNGGQVSVRIPDNLKVFEGPANGKDATVIDAYGAGKVASQRNVLDNLLGGHYVRVADAGRWIRNIGQQNAGNPKYDALRNMSDDKLVALNKDKIVTISMDGVPTQVISQQNVSTGLFFNDKNQLQMAGKVKTNGGTVDLH